MAVSMYTGAYVSYPVMGTDSSDCLRFMSLNVNGIGTANNIF